MQHPLAELVSRWDPAIPPFQTAAGEKVQQWVPLGWAAVVQEHQDDITALKCLTCIIISFQSPEVFGRCNSEVW